MPQATPRTFIFILLAPGLFLLGRYTAPGLSRQTAAATTTVAGAARGEHAALPAREEKIHANTDPVSVASEPSLQAWRQKLEAQAPSPAREEELLVLLGAWARVDPLAAHAYARKQLTHDAQAQAFTTIFTHWAEKDAVGAWAWVQANEPEEHSHLRAVLVETARHDPALGASFAASLVSRYPEQAAELYVYVLDGAMHDGNYTAARQIASEAIMPNEEQKNSLLNFLAGQWARYQPEQAAPWVLSLPAGPVRDQAVDALGQAWADIDPVRAANFAVTLPPGESRQTALRQAISKWTLDDPATASKWVLQFDAHQDFDQAVAAIATSHNLISRNINLALGWAETIQNPALRRESTTTVVSNWYAMNPTAALDYIKTSPDLSTEVREDLLAKVATQHL